MVVVGAVAEQVSAAVQVAAVDVVAARARVRTQAAKTGGRGNVEPKIME